MGESVALSALVGSDLLRRQVREKQETEAAAVRLATVGAPLGPTRWRVIQEEVARREAWFALIDQSAQFGPLPTSTASPLRRALESVSHDVEKGAV